MAATASLTNSPLYRRKSAADWHQQTGENGGKFWMNAKTGRKVYQAENPGGEEGTAQPDAAPDPKIAGYASQLKEKFGDQAGAKVAAMAEQLRGIGWRLFLRYANRQD